VTGLPRRKDRSTKGAIFSQIKDPILLVAVLIATFIVTSFLFVGLLTVSNFVSPERIISSIEPDIDEIVDRGSYPRAFDSESRKSTLDRFTDSIMLMQAIPDPSMTAFENAVLAPYLDYVQESGRISPPISLREKIADPSLENNNNYFLYWHGYTVPMRMVLSLFTFSQVIIVNYILLVALILVVAEIFRRTAGIKAVIAFALALLLMNIWAVPQSFQLVNMFFLSLFGVIALYLLLVKGKERIWIPSLFLVLGMATSFFDFLTIPLVTLLLPLLLLVLWRMKDERQSLFAVVGLTVTWVMGYVGFWAAKWLVLLKVHTSPDLVNTLILSKLNERSGMDAESTVSRIGAISRNFSLLHWNPDPLIVGDYFSLRIVALSILSFVVAWAVIFWLSGADFKRLKLSFPLLILASAPYLWYFVISNHSYIHYWFTYRAQLVSVFAFLLFVMISIDWKKLMNRWADKSGKERLTTEQAKE